MNRLAQAIAERIVAHVTGQVANLQGEAAEFRAVFNGPPHDILETLYTLLTLNGGIEATLGTGEVVNIPVVMQVDQLSGNAKNPPVGVSGQCDINHLLDLRNSPNCPRFIGLVPPGHQANLSQTSTRSDFGLAAKNNSGTSDISDWWNDKFIQGLIKGALEVHGGAENGQIEDSLKLVELAIFAANEVDKHGTSRRGEWLVLSRLWSLSDNKSLPFGSLVSLACGYPPNDDGSLDVAAQVQTLKALSGRLEENGVRPAIDQIKQQAETDEEKSALDEVLQHLLRKCSVQTALARSMPHYYGPFIAEAIGVPPNWWHILTVEKWIKLLEEDDTRKGAIKLECMNSMISQVQGIVPVVKSSVKLRIILPDSVMAGTNVTITRDVAGAKNRQENHQEWTIAVDKVGEIEDDGIPSHKAPARYSAVAEGFKKGSLKVISLGTWEPGFIVCSRAATKGVVPKQPRNSREKIAYETSLVLNGVGRHYLDVYVKQGIRPSESAYGSNEHGQKDENINTPISRVSDFEYGFEIETTSEGFYQFQISREGGAKEDIVRINLACDEATPEKCGSEFERLIRLNRQREGRATTDVQVNRQLRCAVLQSWLVDKDRVEHTFYPLVLAPDYAQDWRPRDWTSSGDTIFSQGRFLNDPRPSPEEMRPPESFIKFRKEIVEKIRGDDGNGLVEAARLGEWLASDIKFCEMVEGYVRAYLEWLESAPDIAAWCDIAIVTRFESDGTTLIQEPEAILVSPIHPIRLAWHCLAQRALFLAQKKAPCPAASILDPDCIPDALVLPLRTAAGGIRRQVFFSVECSSDYWSILWNGAKLDRLAVVAGGPPFDQEFGVLVGGISSGFSVSQVHRALDDVSEMLVAKPVINVLVSSAAGQNNACNEGLISWCKEHFTVEDRERPVLTSMGARFIQILDERKAVARPEDAEISNLGEDTGNSVRWYVGAGGGMTPDLGIIAQLETSSPGSEEIKIGSPLAVGGLIRTRVRQQLKAAAGAFLCETRMGLARPSSGDGLADKTVAALVRLENLGEVRYGYSFAPSIHAIQTVLQKADYAAVSSSAVDPACFLGGWLGETYLWDYDLPAYSNRSGDSNGYYLLSKIKVIDRETLRSVLSRLPECQNLPELMLDDIILEVARRGIPTIRGLSSGSSGASGDLGLFVAARLFQDEFRLSKNNQSLLPIWTEVDGLVQIILVIPVDPFRGYLDDLTRAISKQSHQRPDLIIVAIHLSDSQIRCKLTPVEVKYRKSKDTMSDSARLDALEQAKSLSNLLGELGKRSNESELALWKIAFQHLLVSMLNFGFRVYSQQPVVSNNAERWSEHHARIVEAIFSDDLKFEVDFKGRLIVIDGSKQSAPLDDDNDDFRETIVLSHGDASEIVKGDAQGVYDSIKAKIKDWNLLPNHGEKSGLDKVQPDAHVESPEKIEGNVIMVAPNESNLTEGAAHLDEDEECLITGINRNVSTVINAPIVETITPEKVAVSTGVDLLIGNTVDGFHEEVRRLNLSDTNLNQLNIGVVGDLGTGKTQLLKSLIYQITQNAAANQDIKPNILIFDYKKDYSSDEFVKAVGARVVKPWHLPINIFDVAGAGEAVAPWLERFKFFSDVLDKIFSGVGPVQRAQLKDAVRQAYNTCTAEGRQPNIYDVHSNYHAIVSKADSVSSIIDDLVDMEIFSPEPTSASSVDNFLEGIVVISLDALGQDDRTKNMLVAIMLNIFYEHMLRIPKRPYVGVDQKLRVVDSFLLVDEADNIMRYEFDILRKILLQGREFGVGVILASQYLRHFKAGATDYREPLLTWFIHKVPNVTPQELAALGLIGNVNQLSERVKSLLLHECLFKTFNISGEIVKGIPFYSFLKKD